MTRIEHLESRIDALEEAIREEYMRLILEGNIPEAMTMLRELDRKGGMPQRSETVCLTGDDPSRTATARGVSCIRGGGTPLGPSRPKLKKGECCEK